MHIHYLMCSCPYISQYTIPYGDNSFYVSVHQLLLYTGTCKLLLSYCINSDKLGVITPRYKSSANDFTYTEGRPQDCFYFRFQFDVYIFSFFFFEFIMTNISYNITMDILDCSKTGAGLSLAQAACCGRMIHHAAPSVPINFMSKSILYFFF